jgi:DNA-binding NarL/FixJ family response regulator
MSVSNVNGNKDPNFRPRRLTNRQLSVVRELADGCDIAMVAARRDRGLSSVYEIVGRICERLGLDDWRQIGPYAREHGLVDGLEETRTAA